MNFLVFLVLLSIIVIVSVALPMLSSVGNFQVSKKENVKSGKKKKAFDFSLKSNSKNEESKCLSSNLAMNLRVDSKTGLKRRVIGEYDREKDPNEFDFDIDELIEEERGEEIENERKRVEQFHAQGQDSYETLV
ncbi:hypothetical protein TPHA_0G00860 [Tetrapisispora phaffii CBS 4417]|uniref:Uncharacterized protein n=1 Tax=Tetrapisispora phaffii (strain ATCC 24235 / CBS 4417 / NBRC 1672 / NRRL Y-8282 / UCD 70-5) TaxID=1071381 RepID=G8BVJ4_TETPH|nr:hypothetical protein TPHA_0G00860 [Tetrapisispora phaffii CBS 4417]CCE63922.1 hypothetical protein TPHA_0G00860 [Tetrapisispora phaffii CBS 4417]